MDTPVVVIANQSDWFDDTARYSALLVVIQYLQQQVFKAAPAAVPTGNRQMVENL
jgi:hypothetical protein